MRVVTRPAARSGYTFGNMNGVTLCTSQWEQPNETCAGAGIIPKHYHTTQCRLGVTMRDPISTGSMPPTIVVKIVVSTSACVARMATQSAMLFILSSTMAHMTVMGADSDAALKKLMVEDKELHTKVQPCQTHSNCNSLKPMNAAPASKVSL